MADEESAGSESKMEETTNPPSAAASTAAGAGAEAGATMRFELKKWNAVTMWSWDICADTCAICRNSLNEPSIEYQVRLSVEIWG